MQYLLGIAQHYSSSGLGLYCAWNAARALEYRIKLFQAQCRVRGRLAVGPVSNVAGQMRQQLGGDGAIKPLGLATPLRNTDPGMDQLDLGVQTDPLKPGGGEIRAVIRIEHTG